MSGLEGAHFCLEDFGSVLPEVYLAELCERESGLWIHILGDRDDAKIRRGSACVVGGFCYPSSETLLVIFEGGFHEVWVSTQGNPRAPRSHRDAACTQARSGDPVLHRGCPV